MTPFTELIAGLADSDGGDACVVIPDDWMQGRTTYGGLTAALCLEAARRTLTSAPPLRSAQISFVGPVGGAVRLNAEILRAGKSMTFAAADIHGEKGLAARAVFAFGGQRPSMFERVFETPPDAPGPEDSEPFFGQHKGPPFAQHYEVRLARGARPMTSAEEHDHFLWVRHRDRQALDIVALVALADMPPPAVLSMFPEPAPISTATWSMNFLTDAPATEEGWWLLRSRAENASHGYSSQDMQIWNRAGGPVVAGRQLVAIFI